MRAVFVCLVGALITTGTGGLARQSTPPDAKAVEAEALRHFQAILRLDTSNPPGNEGIVVEYLKDVLQQAGIETKTFGLDPKRTNLVARLRGIGKKRPVLIMGHTDVVTVDPAKWTHPPFSATREDGYVYGRATLDDKDSVVAGLMTLLQLKRANVPLDRDVIFLAEASEEGNGPYGINYMVGLRRGADDRQRRWTDELRCAQRSGAHPGRDFSQIHPRALANREGLGNGSVDSG